jgi:type IV fimbrial biogenesis protein FimT
VANNGLGGFTLVELMITILIVAISVALAVPGWDAMVQKRHVTSAAEQIAAFVGFAQSEAVKRSQRVTLTVKRDGAGTDWCVGAVNQSRMEANGLDHCECDAGAADPTLCAFDALPQVLTQAAFEDFTMDSASVGGAPSTDFHFNFDPVRGIKVADDGFTVDPNIHRLSVLSDNTRFRLQVEVAATGRVRICSPDAAQMVPGYKDC